jgi:hypothetical protein
MYKLILPLLLALMLVACQDVVTLAESEETLGATATKTYTVSLENFPNPERGFFQTPIAWNGFNPASAGLTLTDLQRYRQQGLSMIRAVYYIPEFKGRDVSAAFLSTFRQHLADVRTAGLKMIPTFAYSKPADYNFAARPDLFENQDAPLSDVLRHLEQLKPVIQANSDVIAIWDGGFIGAWGEWHTSTNNLIGTVYGSEVNSNTRQIINKLLEVVPSNRAVALRYPRHKQEFTGRAPLTAGEAFRGSAKARIGQKNDCFLASQDDFGTYWPVDTDSVWAAKDYLRLDNLFVPQFGETCWAEGEAKKYITCKNALLQLDYVRYSALNIAYNEDVLNGWRQEPEECFTRIARRLGYRFELVSSSTPASISKTQNLQMNFVVRNTGWANPYNPRRLELILRNTVTKSVYRIVLNNGSLRPTNTNLDPRFWQPDTTTTVSVNSPLPANIPAGNYELLLNLPDPYRQLRNRPEYSIRLANENLWEASTGFNSLQQSLTIR